MTEKRFEYIPGLGIKDTKTDAYYITLLEATGLLNKINQKKDKETQKQ